jgi:hypothetical protein
LRDDHEAEIRGARRQERRRRDRHGHIHDSADYRVGATRVIANPHGYGRENAKFDPTFIIEVRS